MNVQFKKDLTKLLNVYCIDSACNMPDDMLAEYIINILQTLASNTTRDGIGVFETGNVEIHADGVKDAH